MKSNSIDQEAGVLIVDDHTISRHFTVQSLHQLSSNIRQARTGLEAISISRSWFPRLIFTDIHLPDTCGLDMVNEIRSAWPQEPALPHIIITTGDRSSQLRQRVEQANVAGILLKPVRMEDIRASAQRLLHTGCTVQESSEPSPAPGMDQELREFFSRELATRLPRLDEYISQLDWKPASELLHQLIASSAICHEKELENYTRLLYRIINETQEPKAIAQAYHPFLRAATRTKMHL